MKASIVILLLLLPLVAAAQQVVQIDIGGRKGLNDRSYISIFGASGAVSTTGTVTDTVGGQAFTATFSLSVASTDGNPGIAYRGTSGANNFIGVATDGDGQQMNSGFSDQVAISFASIDNTLVTFEGFTSISLGNIGSNERATVNGVDTGNITGAIPVDLTVAPHSLPSSVTVISTPDTGGGTSQVDVAELTLRFALVADPNDMTPPSVPAGLIVTPGNGEVVLDWDDNGENDFFNYRVYRRTTASAYQIVGSPTASGFADLGLHNGYTYFYSVTATDLSGNESGGTPEVEAIPEVAGDELLSELSGLHFEDYAGFPHLAALPADFEADGDRDGDGDTMEFEFGSGRGDPGDRGSATVTLGPGNGSPPVVTYRERISSPGFHTGVYFSTDLVARSRASLTELDRFVLPDGRTDEVAVRLDDPGLLAAPRVFVQACVGNELFVPRFAVGPEASTTTTVTMSAGEADLDPRSVEYLFESVAGGGHDSGWQRNRLYIDSGLVPGGTFSYRIKLRRLNPVDGMPVPGSESGWSRTASATTPVTGKRPNIIVFMADDLGYECFDIYGVSDHDTPHIAQMAAEGIKFTNFHAQPLCTPSRVQIMSGQYNQRNITTFGDYEPDKSFATFFRQAGYRTCVAGKWQLDYRVGGDPDTNTTLPQRPVELGFDEYLLWNVTGSQQGSRYWSPKLVTTTPVGNPFNIINGSTTDYGPELVNDFINDFATSAVSAGEPFLIYCPLIDPHSPFVTPPGYAGLSGNKAKHQAMVEYMDGRVGETLDLVRNNPALAGNTLVIFTCDNGSNVNINTVFNGTGYQGGKAGTFDPGTHVAFVAWGLPAIPAGSVSDDLADMTDILPTIADVAGVPIPGDYVVDGRSLRSQFHGRSRDPRRWVYGYYFDSRNAGSRRNAWVRNKHFKLYQDGLDHTGTPYVGSKKGQFFDVLNDERETTPRPAPAPGSRLEALKVEFQAVLDRMDADDAPGNN